MSFARLVAQCMERIAPLKLAEVWDNTGLLLESIPKPKKSATRKILLTIDLTPPVAHEAINKNIDVVISYHPPIFRPLASLTLYDPIQTSLLRLAASGTSVYTPHTALDSVTGGINDWLCLAFVKPDWVQNKGGRTSVHGLETKYVVEKPEAEGRGGGGRIVCLPEPGLSIEEVVPMVKRLLGEETLIQVAEPYEKSEDKMIKTVAVCAGSGGSLFKDVEADLYFTGEMSHHEILAAIGKGRYVILCGHTNTERGYLKTLRQKLMDDKELGKVSVEISEKDAHPLRVWQ